MWQRRERAEDRGDARLRRRGRPRGAGSRRGLRRGSTQLIERDRPHARAPVRRPAHDRRARARSGSRCSRTCRTSTSSSSRSAAAAWSPGSRPPSRRCSRTRAWSASSPSARRRCTPRSTAGEPVPVEPSSIADGLDAPFAGDARARDLPRARRRGRARHRGRDRGGVPLPLRRARSSPASRPARPRRRRCWPERCALEPGETRRRGRLGRQRGRRNGRCYPGRAMKADIHPDYVLATVHCSCGNDVPDALDEARAARRDLLELPPVLHGQAEADRHRRPRRALPAPAREGRPPRKAARTSHERSRSAARPSSRA